jgi:diguanylate cyclase (GGDEF)-like protein
MKHRALPSPRLLAVVAPVSLAGLTAYVAAGVAFAVGPHTPAELAGVGALLAASAVAERYPVPVEGTDANGVSLGFVFAVAGLVLFGWAAGTVIYATAPTLVAIVERRPPIRTAFNAGLFGLVGTLAGALLTLVPGDDVAAVVAQVALTAGSLYTINMVLVSAAIAASGSQRSYRGLLVSNIRWTAAPFALMASTSLVLVVLWQRTPLLSVALVGPLLAISLYQRSTHQVLRAMQLALTDPLTALGNHRHFQERLQRELTAAQDAGITVSICLLDVDDFKRVNDRFGHPIGDRVLSQVAAKLRQGGEAFRVGGDEFAVLMAGSTEREAIEAAESIVARIDGLAVGRANVVTASAGVATYPQHGSDRDALIRLADSALYCAKRRGKNQVCVASAEIAARTDQQRSAGRETQVEAAGALAPVADAESQ